MNKTLLCILGSVALTSPLVAQPTPAIGLKQLPSQSTVVDGILVPVPREIFHTLDKFRHSNWRAVQRPELAKWRPPGDQEKNALLLGAVIAEGFIAAEAEDAVEVKNLGRAVLKLARGLGVEKAALRRSRSIVDYAEQGNWPAVRKEWDGVLPDVQQGMMQLRSEQRVRLVSLGGWLRGMEALAGLVAQNYSDQDARLLRQPAMFDYFEEQLAKMSADIRTDPTVVRLDAGIREVQEVLGSADGPVSQKKVQQVSAISAGLVQSLNR